MTHAGYFPCDLSKVRPKNGKLPAIKLNGQEHGCPQCQLIDRHEGELADQGKQIYAMEGWAYDATNKDTDRGIEDWMPHAFEQSVIGRLMIHKLLPATPLNWDKAKKWVRVFAKPFSYSREYRDIWHTYRSKEKLDNTKSEESASVIDQVVNNFQKTAAMPKPVAQQEFKTLYEADLKPLMDRMPEILLSNSFKKVVDGFTQTLLDRLDNPEFKLRYQISAFNSARELQKNPADYRALDGFVNEMLLPRNLGMFRGIAKIFCEVAVRDEPLDVSVVELGKAHVPGLYTALRTGLDRSGGQNFRISVNKAFLKHKHETKPDLDQDPLVRETLEARNRAIRLFVQNLPD
ncbi:MAG: hypothetical protein HY537_00495 [Deltaproteobacteria bacterium]|nr:hypothetical protein [Deltaproteobacteria bacterium]